MSTTDKKFANGMYAFTTDKDWLPLRLSLDVKQFAETLVINKELASQNEGKLNIDIKKSGGGKLYAEINTWQKPKEVTSKDHSPDREEADLPF